MSIHTKNLVGALRLTGVILLLIPSSSRAALSVFQAEAGLLTDVVITTQHSGFEGSGYADFNDIGGGSIAWTYDATSSGDVEMVIRYATMNERPLDLYVDGTKRASFSCKNTGSWTKWAMEKTSLTIDQGVHTILLEARFSGPNVDWLSVVSSDESPPKDTTSPTTPPHPDTNSSIVVYQAETALFTKVSMQTVNSGYDGSGYADYQGVGAFLRWSVDIPKTTNYEVKAKYASVNERNCNLYIDGTLLGTYTFQGTGAWTKWNEEGVIVSLTQGTHELIIIAETSAGPNIDWISIEPFCSTGCNYSPAPAPSIVPSNPQPSGTMVNFPSRIVLSSNNRLEKGQFVFSREFILILLIVLHVI